MNTAPVIQLRQRIQCAWCKDIMQTGIEPVSHGICADCSTLIKGNENPLQWDLPMDSELSDDWRDSYIALQLADVMSRRHYGQPFKKLSVEDRLKVRDECESFVARMAYLYRSESEVKETSK